MSTIGSADRPPVTDRLNGGGSARRFSPPIRNRAVNEAVERVHVVFKTHLDIGFSDLAATIVARYMDEFIPKAISLSERMRVTGQGSAGGSTDQPAGGFIWTTGSWLIHEYLERADSAGRRRMEAAIEAGDVAWHALPFSLFSENMDASLFRFGLSLSQRLDARFGRRTIAAKMTDVPGHTRGIVPLLAEAGVELLHIGVNAASTPPDVPPLFVWRDPASEAEIVVMYQGNYGDVMVVPGLADALAFAHTDDNVGPQSADQLDDVYRALAARFPDARIHASTMDAFAERLRPIRDGLPVITKEIGDTWIYGVASDPQKEAEYRALLRLRRAWLASGASATDLEGFSGKLLLVPEHTNGLDVKTHLDDWTHYSRRDFEAVRGQANFRRMEASWQEQRDYVGAAVSALPERWRSEATDVLAELKPARPDPTLYERIADLAQPLQTEHFTVAIDERVGSLIRLQSGDTDWAGPASPLGTFWYETYSAADYARFRRQYLINKRTTSWYARPDFTKPGIDGEAGEHRVFRPQVTWSGRRVGDEEEAVLLLLDLPAEAHERFGAPGQLSIELVFPRDEPRVDFVVQWFDKSANRLPEAAWFSFVLPDHGPRWRRSWRMDKLGEWVSPLDVVRNGNRRLHAVGSGLCADDGRLAVSVETLDAPLVAPGRPSLIDFGNRQPDLRDGFHVNLHNNLWGTDFPQWYQDDARFRFSLRPTSTGGPGGNMPRRSADVPVVTR